MKTNPFKMLLTNEIEKYRYNTLYTKEPETIAWIDDIPDGDTFIDIGANIGIYSLYMAATHPDSRVIVVEPVPVNRGRLSENIRINKFKNIDILHYMIGPDTATICCNVGIRSPGHTYTKKLADIDDPDAEEIEQEKLDNITKYLNTRYHVKIDTDGSEGDIIGGAYLTLRDAKCQSMMIEFSDRRMQKKISNYIMKQGKGWTPVNKYNTMTPHSTDRRAKEPGNTAINVVYTRGDFGKC